MTRAEWDRPEWRTSEGHPSLKVGQAYAEKYLEAVRAGFSQADARDEALHAAERVARQRRAP